MKSINSSPNSDSGQLSCESIGVLHALWLGTSSHQEELYDALDHRSLSTREVAEYLRVDRKWVRDHLAEFPHRTVEGQSIRIPGTDLKAALERWRVAGVEKMSRMINTRNN